MHEIFAGFKLVLGFITRFLFNAWHQTHTLALCRTLNRIQSRIYHTAFNSNENLLVCAPTGAGKTNIAMIAVLREIASNMRSGVIQKGDFKIVYVAPMKALAAEVTATFSRRLAALGAPVCSSVFLAVCTKMPAWGNNRVTPAE